MKRKHAITTAIVVVILALLVFLQIRTWRTFDWAKFRAVTSGVNWWFIAAAVAITYFVYVLRAMRWAIFLRPTKNVPFRQLIAPQFIGFTGLALLGRPGEFVRPYLIARQEKLPFSSQLAAWVVERVFDVSSVALLLGSNLVIAGAAGDPFAKLQWARRAGIAMLALAFVLAVIIVSLWLATPLVSRAAERTLRPLSAKFAASVAKKLHTFGEGIRTLADWKSFIAVAVLSLLIWLAIAQCYIFVLHAYPQGVVAVASARGPQVGAVIRLHEMHLPHVLIVMSASMFGSVLQLPGVGGGSQLAVVGTLSNVFGGEPYNITPELAVSCAMMLWLTTFMSVIPAGLLMAHFNRISLRAIGEESEEEAEEEIAHPHAHDA